MTARRLCYKCKNEKELTDFNKSQYDKDGYRHICRDCRNTHRRVIRRYEKHYYVLSEEQNNCCAICGKSEKDNGQRLAIDHNHTTHQVRALLCRNCNTGLGAFKDNFSLLESAVEYLKHWNKDATS